MKKYVLIFCLLNMSFASQVNAELSRTLRDFGFTTFLAGTFGTFASGISWAGCSYEKICPANTQEIEVTYNFECTYCEENPIGNHCNQTQPGYCFETLKQCQISNGTIIDSERKTCEAPKIAFMTFGGVLFVGVASLFAARSVEKWEMSYDTIDEERLMN